MPNSREEPREYRIAPRYLAHPEADGSAAVEALVDAGWAQSHDGAGNTFVTAPDLTARLAHLPEADGPVMWKISAGPDAFAPPQWLVTFDHLTPPEVVTDFTTALADAYAQGPGGYLGGSRGSGTETALELLTKGWTIAPTTHFLSYQSPDRLVRFHFRDKPLPHSAEMAGDTERLLVEVGPARACWYATASSRLPDRLLQQFTAAVTDPTPVRRPMRRIDLEHLPAAATATPIAPSPLEVARVRAATSRSLSAPALCPPPLAPPSRRRSLGPSGAPTDRHPSRRAPCPIQPPSTTPTR
ncbi:DUF317 domain-containing protein [Kitasatospora cineracea]|uniref:DUF317 domain-containing protein n=1 Tax=Kitasatospora cineracea TaxID=88074 RepID=UPI00381C17D1